MGGCWGRCGVADACVLFIFDLLTRAADQKKRKNPTLPLFIRLVLGWVRGWVARVGFLLPAISPDPPDLLELVAVGGPTHRPDGRTREQVPGALRVRGALSEAHVC